MTNRTLPTPQQTNATLALVSLAEEARRSAKASVGRGYTDAAFFGSASQIVDVLVDVQIDLHSSRPDLIERLRELVATFTARPGAVLTEEVVSLTDELLEKINCP